MFKKSLTVKNLFFALAIVLIVGAVIAPKDFLQKKETSSAKPKEVQVVSKASQPDNTQEETQNQKSSPAPITQTQPTNQVKGSTSKTQTTAPTYSQSSYTTGTSGSTNEAGIPVREVTLNIDAGSYGSFSYKVAWVEGDSVWDVLDKASNEHHFSIEKVWNPGLKSYYIKGLEGNNCECWTYKVNSTCPSVGASVTKVNENDVILWSVNNIC